MPNYPIEEITRKALAALRRAGIRGVWYGGYFCVGFEAFGGGVAYRVKA